MKKIAFITHEFDTFKGHGGVAMYLKCLVTEMLKRCKEYDIYVITIMYDKKSKLLNNQHLYVYQLETLSPHDLGKKVLEYIKKISPDIIECVDYMGLGLESICERYYNPHSVLKNSKFVTVHHTASRECYEWNDRVPVKFAPEFVRECFGREKTQMKLSDLNVAPTTFINNYVSKNYYLEDVVTILHPLTINLTTKENLIEEISKEVDIEYFKNKFVVSCISRIEGRKNQKLLVDQFVKFLDQTNIEAYLFIVGNSSVNSVTGQNFKNEIFKYIPEKYEKNILFFDFMNGEEKKKVFAVSDVFVLASVYECLSLALVEAVEYGVAVITSKYCGFTDYMGISKDVMTFDPFQKDALLTKLFNFYYMKDIQRCSISETQLSTLKEKADYKTTIDKRINIYENINIEQERYKFNSLVIDEENYLNIIDEDVINRNYDSFLVHFYFNKNLVEKLKLIFHNVANKFEKEAVICYAENKIQEGFVNAVLDWHPFFVCHIDLLQFKGKRLIDLISYYCNKAEIYSLIDNKKRLVDVVYGKVSNQTVKRREMFRKRMLADHFYYECSLSLEDKYVE